MNVTDLRSILQYVPRFRDKIFVIALDGEIIASENFSNILMDIAVLRSLNLQIILVHGISHQISLLSQKLGISITNHDGNGITDKSTLDLAIRASLDITHKIMESFSSLDLCAVYSNTITAHPKGLIKGADQLLTGHVERIDHDSLIRLLDNKIIPVIPPLGFDGEGRTYRVNSDSIAREVAISCRAAKMIFLTAYRSWKTEVRFPRQLSLGEAELFIKKLPPSDITPGIISKIESSIRACRSGLPRSHLLNGSINAVLLTEIFTPEGSGMMIHSNEYQQIRRLLKKDVRVIINLIQQSVEDEEILHRTRTDILENIEDYWILESDRIAIACVAVHLNHDIYLAEMACLYVSKTHENKGYGRKLMAFAENLAREKGMKTIYALSTRAIHYLQQKGGYQETDISILPLERKNRYLANKRNSKIFFKSLIEDKKNNNFNINQY